MRKDVKLGFTVGGVLLAVLIVYVLVISSGPKQTSDISLAKPELTPVQEGAPQAQPAGQVPDSADPNKPIPGDAATIDPFKPTGADAGLTDAQDRWVHALDTGKVPLLMTETPAPPDKSANAIPAPAEGSRDTQAQPGGTVPLVSPGAQITAQPGTPNNSPAANGATGDTLAAQILGSGPATQPASVVPGTTKRTHVIQRGESFTTIAAAVYGNGAYYPHLLRANPNIDPKKLRPGMTIVIPDPAEVVAARGGGAQSASNSVIDPVALGTSTTPAAAIDQKSQYRVQQNDSLYKISVKLYGKADHVDKLYELNKETIGANPAHLKVGMLLKLPDPPTGTASVQEGSAAR